MPTFELKCPYCESKNVVSKNTKLKYGGLGAAAFGVLGALAFGPIGLLGGAAIGAFAGTKGAELIKYHCSDCGKDFTVCSKCNGHVEKLEQVGSNAWSQKETNGIRHYTPGAKCPLCGYVFRQPRTTFTPNNNNNNNSNNGYQQDVNQYIDYDDYDD